MCARYAGSLQSLASQFTPVLSRQSMLTLLLGVVLVITGWVLVVSARERWLAFWLGWRVGRVGSDDFFYEEQIDGTWQRISIRGQNLNGDGHAIYFASEQEWQQYPPWAKYRRAEIHARIKSRFPPPQFMYEGHAR